MRTRFITVCLPKDNTTICGILGKCSKNFTKTTSINLLFWHATRDGKINFYIKTNIIDRRGNMREINIAQGSHLGMSDWIRMWLKECEPSVSNQRRRPIVWFGYFERRPSVCERTSYLSDPYELILKENGQFQKNENDWIGFLSEPTMYQFN